MKDICKKESNARRMGNARRKQRSGEGNGRPWLVDEFIRKTLDRWKIIARFRCLGIVLAFHFKIQIHSLNNRNDDVTGRNWAIQIVTPLFKVSQN